MVLVPLKAVDVGGEVIQGENDGFNGFGLWSGSCRLQGPMGGGSGGVICPQVSYLLASCWNSNGKGLSLHIYKGSYQKDLLRNIMQ